MTIKNNGDGCPIIPPHCCTIKLQMVNLHVEFHGHHYRLGAERSWAFALFNALLPFIGASEPLHHNTNCRMIWDHKFWTVWNGQRQLCWPFAQHGLRKLQKRVPFKRFFCGLRDADFLWQRRCWWHFLDEGDILTFSFSNHKGEKWNSHATLIVALRLLTKPWLLVATHQYVPSSLPLAAPWNSNEPSGSRILWAWGSPWDEVVTSRPSLNHSITMFWYPEPAPPGYRWLDDMGL